MSVSQKIAGFMEHSSWIRRMFEEGNRLRAEYGADKVFDFSLGNPNVEPPEMFQKALLELVSDSTTTGTHGYMSNAGFEETRQAVAREVSLEQQVQVPASNIVMTSGAGGALNCVFKAILDPGDEVIVPKPYFVEYDFYVDNHGGVLKPVPTTEDFELDLDAIEAAITPATRAIILNSPHNPTGRVYSAESIEALGKLLERMWVAERRLLYLVADEPYRKIVFDGLAVPPLMPYYVNTIVCTSYSKELSLAGERIGYAAVHPGITDCDLVVGGIILANRILGFVNAPALMQRVVARIQGSVVDLSLYDRNRRVLYETLTEIGFQVPRPEGTFYLFPKSPIDDDVQFVRELLDKRILVTPGRGFGGPGHFRIAYCVSAETVDGALPGFREIGARYFG